MFGTRRTKLAISMKRLVRTVSPRRFVRRADGSVAVEFGLVMVPFFAIMFAIMETALVFFAGQTLETAAADASRLIMTGQAQNQALTQTTFKDAVCARIYGLFNCSTGVYVDVQNPASFSSADTTLTTAPLDSNGNLVTSGFGYSPGGPCDIVLVRLFYQWPITISLLGLNLSNMSGGRRLLVATAAFKNEPYNTSASCP
jgi:Flp pilus assembly protein TadG